MNTYSLTKKEFKSAFRTILSSKKNYELDEAAFPAYAHKNIFIDYLFWKRVEVAFNFAKNHTGNKKVLDFGCGSGVLSYLLAKNNYKVTAVDIEFSPLLAIKEKIEFPENIKFIEGDITSMNLPDKSFDIIFALDVLEHIDDLQNYIALFQRLLTDTGVIIVSGPTENILYKTGRKLAGSRFTGDYHVTNIAKIKTEFEATLSVKTIKKLIFPLVLFELFAARKKNQSIC